MSSVIINKKALRELVNEIYDNTDYDEKLRESENVIQPNPLIGTTDEKPTSVQGLNTQLKKMTSSLRGEEIKDFYDKVIDSMSDKDDNVASDEKKLDDKKGTKMKSDNVEEAVRNAIRKLVREAWVKDPKSGSEVWQDEPEHERGGAARSAAKAKKAWQTPASGDLPAVTRLPTGASARKSSSYEKNVKDLQGLLGKAGAASRELEAGEEGVAPADEPVAPVKKQKTPKREKPSAIRSKIEDVLAKSETGGGDPMEIVRLMTQLKDMEHIVDEVLPDEDAQLYFSLYKTSHNFMLNRYKLEDDDAEDDVTAEEEEALYQTIPKDNPVFDKLFNKVLKSSSPVVAAKAKATQKPTKQSESDDLADELYGYWVAKREELNKSTKLKGSYLLDERLAQNHREFLLAVGRALLENAATGASFVVDDDDGSKLSALAQAFELSTAGAKALAEQTLARWALEQKSDVK